MIKIKVYKSTTIPIHTSKLNIDYLYQCNKEAGKVWNECVRLNKELWELKQKYTDRKYLQTELKGFNDIMTAKSIQMVEYKYLTAISAIQHARKVGRTDLKYPWKQKKYYNTMWDIQNLQIDYDKNTIRIPRPVKYNYYDSRGKKKSSPIILHCKTIPQNITQVELVYKNGLKLAINYWIEEECLQIKSNNICGVDLGEIHSITTIDTNSNALIITGRELRSIKRFRNKELGKLERKLSKCTKGSNNYKKYRKSIRKLLTKTNNKVNDNLKKTARLFSNYVLINNISTIVVGDLKLFNMQLRNRKQYKGAQQRLVQWEHGQLVLKIKNNLKNYGIEVIEISEAYTSQTCPFCGNKYKPKNRNYVCIHCGAEYHRDLVGARNILSKYINQGKIKYIELENKPLKYLRIA